MIKRIVFATGNKDKLREATQILGDFKLPVVSMRDAKAEADIEENGTTFAENALIKARAVREVLVSNEDIVLADDSGLVIDYLGGEPGIYSARYMGHDTSYHEKNMNLISRLEGVSDDDRSARFVCAIAAILPDGTELTSEGTFEGRIGYEEKGEHGFGYDPIFYLPELGKYSAELSDEEKHARSHRGQALRRMRDILENYL